jgi:rubredoxin
VGQDYLFEDAQGGDLTDCGGGFAFLPVGPLTDTEPGVTFSHLDGNWYTWTCFS